MPLPFEPKGDDISAQLEQHRAQIPGHDLIVTYDGAPHAASRSLLTKLFVPSRLKANEGFMLKFADELVKEKVANGACELIQEMAAPYVTLVIADLLGVPADDRESFRKVIDAGPPPGNMDAEERPHSHSVLEHLGRYFYGYVQDRRANPRADVLTELATAKFPDGSTPELMEIVNLAVFLFAAGQDTSAKLLGNCLRFLVDDLRAATALAQRSQPDPGVHRGGVAPGRLDEGDVPARPQENDGRRSRDSSRRELVVALAATNRDPRRWEDPEAFKLDRPKIKENLAFGRGAHTCIGAPLARAEVRVLLDRLMEHTSRDQSVGATPRSAGKPQARL